jgi:hypothetical protein
MAPLAVAGTWVRLDRLAALIGRGERTLWHWLASGKCTAREQLADGRRVTELLVESLPLQAQQRFVELRAQAERAEQEARAASDAALQAELSSEQVRARLGRFDDITRLAFKREATRRRELLLMWAAMRDKQIGGEWSPGARAIMQEWACPDPLVLAVRPSWGEPGTPATIYRQTKRLAHLGVLALLPEAPKAQRADDGRLRPLHPEVVETAKHMRLIGFRTRPSPSSIASSSRSTATTRRARADSSGCSKRRSRAARTSSRARGSRPIAARRHRTPRATTRASTSARCGAAISISST